MQNFVFLFISCDKHYATKVSIGVLEVAVKSSIIFKNNNLLFSNTSLVLTEIHVLVLVTIVLLLDSMHLFLEGTNRGSNINCQLKLGLNSYWSAIKYTKPAFKIKIYLSW